MNANGAVLLSLIIPIPQHMCTYCVKTHLNYFVRRSFSDFKMFFFLFNKAVITKNKIR